MGNRYCLAIGVESYSDKSISSVKHAENDAKGIANAVAQIGFKTEILLSTNATKTIIEHRIRQISGGAAEEDELIVFYAGHGFSANNENYITCQDTQRSDLVGTSISLQKMLSALKSSPSKQISIFLDSCHSGWQIDSSMRGIYSDLSESELAEFLADAEHIVCFSSCKSNQLSYSDDKLSHGIWSSSVIDVMSGLVNIALEKKRFVTAISLQNYLKSEVPKTLRLLKAGKVIQTPVMFGNLSSDFILADLAPVIAKKNALAAPMGRHLKQISFWKIWGGRVKSLSGFRPGHHVPKEVDGYADNFIKGISEKETDTIREEWFQKIKKALGYKRNEIEPSSSPGYVSLICKDFDLEVQISQDPEDPASYIERYELLNFRDPAVLQNSEFNSVFSGFFNDLAFEFDKPIDVGRLIDQIENLETDSISCEYDAEGTRCDITLSDFNASLSITSTAMNLRDSAAAKPLELVQSFESAQKLLLDYDIKYLT